VCNSIAAIKTGRLISDATSPFVVEAYDGVFGHIIGPPNVNVIRVAFTNIKSLPDNRCNGNPSCRSCKDCLIQTTIHKHRIDHFGMLEVNVNWRYVRDESLKPHQPTENWLSARKITASYFAKYKGTEATHQVGGTLSLTINKYTTRFDPTRLGTDDLG
jgi:hypothetical protein